MMMIFLSTIAAIFALVALPVEARRPNILLIVADDLGWADHEIHVATDIPTPTFKKLSQTGVVLENFYVQTVCSPTRSALMTGRFPFRTGMQHSTTILPGSLAHIPLTVPTIAEVMKAAGYSTHMLGKWHLGYGKWEYTPARRGFNSFFGYLQGQEDYYTKEIGVNFKHLQITGYDFWQNTNIYFRGRGRYSMDLYLERLDKNLDWYVSAYPDEESQADHPLFIYMSHQTVHIPLQARSNETKCSGIQNKWRRTYCSMIVELDLAMEATVKMFESHNLWNNTLLLFTTDNGGMVKFAETEKGDPIWPASIGSNFPLRGSKTSMFEGGVRGTAFINGGDNVLKSSSRGKKYKGLMHAVDFAAICIEAARSNHLQNSVIERALNGMDGINLLPSILGVKGFYSLTRKDVPININYGGKRYTAIRFDEWKLIIGTATIAPTDGWWPIGGAKPERGHLRNTKYHLFKIDDDPFERNELDYRSNETYIQAVRKGLELLHGYMKSYRPPQPNFIHMRSLPMLHHGTWAPFIKQGETINASDILRIVPEEFKYL